MPVQIEENRLVQFRFEPSYLNDYPELKSRPEDVLRSNGFKATFSSINLDGGNVVNCADKTIVTERIFDENPDWDKEELIGELQKLLGGTLYTIPTIKGDLTGHADGHVRFVDNETILVNNLDTEDGYWKEGFFKMIEKSGLNYIEIPWFLPVKSKNIYSAQGIYLNYLELGNLIIFPVFETPGNKDREAFDTIKAAFPNRIIETVNINTIAEEGGLMNCITWTARL